MGALSPISSAYLGICYAIFLYRTVRISSSLLRGNGCFIKGLEDASCPKFLDAGSVYRLVWEPGCLLSLWPQWMIVEPGRWWVLSPYISHRDLLICLGIMREFYHYHLLNKASPCDCYVWNAMKSWKCINKELSPSWLKCHIEKTISFEILFLWQI